MFKKAFAGASATAEQASETVEQVTQEAENEQQIEETEEQKAEAEPEPHESEDQRLNDFVLKSVQAAVQDYFKEEQAKQAEAEKLKAMGEDERRNYELDQREQRLKEREEQIAYQEHVARTTALVAREGLPSEFVELFAKGADAEHLEAAVVSISKVWRQALAEMKRASARQPMPRAAETKEAEPEIGFNLADIARQVRKV